MFEYACVHESITRLQSMGVQPFYTKVLHPLLLAGLRAARERTEYRKYKEATYIACLQNPITRPSFEISPTWHHVIRNELS
jgi:hypothetical protein